jgi:hypothetical protein
MNVGQSQSWARLCIGSEIEFIGFKKIGRIKDYGRPMKPFSKIPNFWAWADKLGRIILGAFGVFSADLSAPILIQ